MTPTGDPAAGDTPAEMLPADDHATPRAGDDTAERPRHPVPPASAPPAPSAPAEPLLSRRSVLLLGAAGVAGIPVLSSGTAGPALESVRDDEDVLDLRRDFGARGDGVADDTRAVQRLLDASALRGAVALVPPGTYRCSSGLLLRSGVHLRLDRGARLLKDWAASPGLRGAFLRNADFAVKSDRVRITGPGSIGARDHTRTGVLLGLVGDEAEIRDITLDTFAGGQAIMYGGDRGRVHRVTVRNSAVDTGTGGVRVIGGADFLGTECHVESGDDCLQFAPIGNPEAEPALYNQSITGGRFVGCTGVSWVSRFMVALLEFTGGDPGTTDMDATVSDCSFTDCHGSAANRGIVVKNTHSIGAVERITFTDCTVDMSATADASTQEIRVQTDPGDRGAIRDVAFIRTDIAQAVNSTLRVGGPNISGLTFDGCTFTAPSGAAPATIVVDGTDRPRFSGCTFIGAAGKRILVAGPVNPVTALSVENCTFTEIGDGAFGVDVVDAMGALVSGSTFAEAAGATTARAIRLSTRASGVVIEGNDLTGITHPQPIADRAADTRLGENRGL